MAQLHLLVPGLLGPFPAGATTPELPGLPNLERVLARADRRSTGGADWQEVLLAVAGVPPGEPGSSPVGALSLLGEGRDPGRDCWLAVEPIHLRADLSRLLVAGAEACGPSPEEADQLVSLFNRHFADRGLHLTAPHPARWYLRAEPCPAIITRSLGDLAGRSPERLLPGGEEGAAWRSLINEAQMLFHGAEVNAEREAQGRPTLNGIWPHGPGRLPEVSGLRVAALFGQGPLLAGLARAGQVPLAALPGLARAMLRKDRDALALYDRLLLPLLVGDLGTWAKELERLDAWMTDLPAGGTLHLYDGRGGHWVMRGSSRWRLWRRRRALIHWIDDG
jgi:hypothetical protein